MTKKERVYATIRRQHIDYLPSQITLADRTRDRELHAALKLPATQTMDEYLENHVIISLAKQDYPLFFRDDEGAGEGRLLQGRRGRQSGLR
jgi:hypothetical protein